MSLGLPRQDKAARAIPLAEQALAIYQQIQDPHVARVEQQLDEWRRT